MKFLLITVFFILTISTIIQCVESLECLHHSDCPFFPRQSCLNGQCRVPRYPMVRGSKNQEGSDSIPCDPECPSSQACYWGKCVQASRKFHAMSWPYCTSDSDCSGMLNACIAGMCLY